MTYEILNGTKNDFYNAFLLFYLNKTFVSNKNLSIQIKYQPEN